MSESPGANVDSSSSFLSSIKDDVWHGRADRHSFERWHFDALSDDGREALVIAFYDNYPFSPRYFNRRKLAAENVNSGQFPAVTFLYAVQGRPVMRAISEWSFDGFSARMDDVICSIGDSTFKVEKAEYGSGYMVHIDLMTARKRRIEADLEWVSIESDLMAETSGPETPTMVWNLAAPRSDVSGRIVRTGIRGKTRKVVHFRGTGYHDHFRSSTSLQEAISSRCWGRAHFADTTVVFQHISFEGGRGDASRIVLIQDGIIISRDAASTMSGTRFDEKGSRLEFISDDGCTVRATAVQPIQRSFFEQRILCSVTLTLPDGPTRATEGIVELCDPKGMYNPLYRWMSDLRIGKNGGSPYL